MQTERERLDLGHMPLLGSVGGEFWGSWAKASLVNSNLKKHGFGKFCPVGWDGGGDLT